jgi:hypothetical protein
VDRTDAALGNVRLFLVGFLTMAVFDCVHETAMVRTQVFRTQEQFTACPSPAVTGTSPLYEPIFASAIRGASGALRYWRDDRGHSWVEQGIDRLKAGIGMAVSQVEPQSSSSTL